MEQGGQVLICKLVKSSSKIFVILSLSLLISCGNEDTPAPNLPPVTEPHVDLIKPALISHDFAFDSIRLTFSEPIQLEFVKSVSDSYDLMILNETSLVTYSLDQTSIKFRCIPCQLGRDFEFEYQVKDTADNVIRQPFQIGYYQAKLTFPIRISDYVIDEQRGIGYVISLEPNKLSLFSLTTYKIVDEVDLNFLPYFDVASGYRWRLSLNPSNRYIYIFSTYSKSIYVYAPDSKNLVKTFKLPAENIQVPEYSSVYPMGIAFTSSGGGLVNSVNQWGNGGLLRSINSVKDDTATVIGPMDAGLMFSVQANGDYSKLFLISEHAPFYYYNGERLSSFSIPDPETNFTFFIPNRKNDLIYMSGHQAQFIIDHVNGLRTGSSYIGLPVAGDFSYTPGEETTCAYLVDNSKLWLLNYEKRRTEFGLLIHDIANVEGLLNTVDGRTMIIQHPGALTFVDLKKLRRKNL